ncbi:hypothetical protein PHACT_03410 [Pseudohongiella acticola]|uniref:Uncharacterized protein n=2 Tax=Pseudohongiella acticola TaxID=1524254 RepID=A0A1E8CIL2_9GAMM|nr:hypothetical protein PHACT_03410 [Pseudohongiella acticola]
MAACASIDNWIKRATTGIINTSQHHSIWNLMLGQILITLLVIIAAVIFLRRQRSREQTGTRKAPLPRRSDPWHADNRQNTPPPDPTGTQAPMASNLKTVLWLVLAGVVTIGSVTTYLQWQDQQRLVTVLLYRDADQNPIIYRVSKRNIGERSFITEDGTQVTVSTNERMEIVGL